MGIPTIETVKEALMFKASKRRNPAIPVPTDAAAASFDALTSKLDYLDPADIRRVRDAYRFADEAHLGQFRVSGEHRALNELAASDRLYQMLMSQTSDVIAIHHHQADTPNK